MQLPVEVRELARQQLGVIARRQFPPHLGRQRIDDLLRSGAFERVERGVYAVRGGTVHRHRDALAAALRVGPVATVSGPAAVELTGPPDVVLDRRYVILRPAPVRALGIGFSLALDREPDRPVSYLGQVRVAGPVDALLDALVLGGLPPRRLRLTHDQLRWAGQLRPGQLRRRAEQLGLSGALGDHELLRLDGTAATGDGERRLGRVLCGFAPAPEPQVWVTPHRCVDWYFRSLRLGVEYQGAADHATEAGRRADTVRDEELSRVGIRLVYVTARDLRDRRALRAAIDAALVARGEQLGLEPPRWRGG
ncbi:MAG: type IV toxin-antitoxin system AbiEi family antitoxin domain-containing protein [Nitriliruptoraceae bacterium]